MGVCVFVWYVWVYVRVSDCVCAYMCNCICVLACTYVCDCISVLDMSACVGKFVQQKKGCPFTLSVVIASDRHQDDFIGILKFALFMGPAVCIIKN